MNYYYNFTPDPHYIFKKQLETSAMIEKKIMENIVPILVIVEIVIPFMCVFLEFSIAYFRR